MKQYCYILTAFACITLAGCGGGSGSSNDSGIGTITVTVSPGTASASQNSKVQLTVTAISENSSTHPVTWKSSDTGIATVDSAGLVTTQSTLGPVIITATSTEDVTKTASCTLTVCTSNSLYTVSSGTITKYSGSDLDVTIPSTIGGTSITAIGSLAFSACTNLSNVTIPASVTTIRDSAFVNCKSLTSISISANVSSIGYSPFIGCTSLTSIDVDTANPNYSSDAGVLFNKSGTKLIQFPGGLSGSYIIPSTVTTIGMQAFMGCEKLTDITIPASVTYVDSYAFARCKSVISINVDATNSNYKSVSGVLFSKDGTMLIQAPGKLSGNYIVPAGVTSLGGHSFSGCSLLTGITLPSGITGVGYMVFSGCTSLTSITIPSGATFIFFAFEGCSSLKTVNLPSSMKDISAYSFHNCTSLAEIKIEATSVPTLGTKAFYYSASGVDTKIPVSIKVPSASLSAYKAAANWSEFADQITGF